MASIEAYQALMNGTDTWYDYVIDRGDRRIDLTFAELAGMDLRRRQFVRCDLHGARMQGANLDGASLSDCDLSGVNLSDVSLVSCRLERVEAKDLHLAGAIIRDSQITASKLSAVSARASRLANVEIRDCVLNDLNLESSVLTDVRCYGSLFNEIAGEKTKILGCSFTDCQLKHWALTDPDFAETGFSECELNEVEFSGGRFVRSRLSQCQIRRFKQELTEVAQLDLVASLVAETNVVSLGPGSAVLLDTAFISCEWPTQKGIISLTGAYTPSPHLLTQPIQDLRGVPPLVRRDAADSQYLVRLLSAAGPASRAGFRVWGATSAYGQSLGRLTAASALVVFFHALGLLAARHQLFGLHPQPSLLAATLAEGSLAFLGIGDVPKAGDLSRAIVLNLRVFGFLALGIWISIAANKVSRLSGE